MNQRNVHSVVTLPILYHTLFTWEIIQKRLATGIMFRLDTNKVQNRLD